MAFSRYSTDGTEAAEDRPGKRFSRQEYLLGSEQLDLPEWLGVPLRQIPPEYEYTHANFNISAFPHSCRWYYNYWIVRERPGLRNLTLKEFSDQIDLDRERMPKVRKYVDPGSHLFHPMMKGNRQNLCSPLCSSLTEHDICPFVPAMPKPKETTITSIHLIVSATSLFALAN